MGDFGKGPPLTKNESGHGYHVTGAPGFEDDPPPTLSGRSIRRVGSLDVGTGDLYGVDGKPLVGPAADKAKLQERLDRENREFNEWHASQGHSVPSPDYNPSKNPPKKKKGQS